MNSRIVGVCQDKPEISYSSVRVCHCKHQFLFSSFLFLPLSLSPSVSESVRTVQRSVNLFLPLPASLGVCQDKTRYYLLSTYIFRLSSSLNLNSLIHLLSFFFVRSDLFVFSRQSVRPFVTTTENPLFCIILSTCDSSAIIVTLV